MIKEKEDDHEDENAENENLDEAENENADDNVAIRRMERSKRF